ncbi:DNA maturase B [Candidatus Terasakiella magnetica]|uniref:DNA maturase B n=1 Tax=Candidatus Terasakiella magnetica TaxID=1867952 RepID=A0A1C3RDU0_9PROT|nr:phage terminase large subunit [Candidatus Terasakiella magnetica]SCA55408.1 DNA maturase B [Candidatus Terasakiella magnetica]
MKKRVAFPEFVMLWDQLQGLSMPQHHLKICRWLDEAWTTGRRELLLMAFRNSGKSTLVGLFCAWLLYQDADRRIMVMAADFALAKKMVRNVKRIIERHPLTKPLKPKRKEQWASDQFTVNRPSELRDPSMLAKGIGANITGSRADVVICDDVEVPNTCDSAPKRIDLRARLQEIDYVLVPGGLQLYVGTPHTYYTIYTDKKHGEGGEDEPFLLGFERFKLPLLDDNGNSQWAERFPDSNIESIRRRTGKNKFESQMMLRPVNISESRLDPDLMQLYKSELDYNEHNQMASLSLEGHKLISSSCWWDPSFGSPHKGDASVIAAVYSDDEGGYWLHGLRYMTHDPKKLKEADEATQLCRQVVAFVKEFYLPSVCLETNGVGKFLPGLLRRELEKEGVSCAVIEKHSRTNKAERILSAFDVVLASRALKVHRNVWRTSFPTEMREWVPSVSAKDDALDAVAGCLLSEPVRLPRTPVHILDGKKIKQWGGYGSAHTAQSDFDV